MRFARLKACRPAQKLAMNRRLLADPEARQNLPEIYTPGSGKRSLLAIGPEGGWVDFERDVLRKNGFRPFTLGARILRVETAIPVIIGHLMLLHHQKGSSPAVPR